MSLMKSLSGIVGVIAVLYGSGCGGAGSSSAHLQSGGNLSWQKVNVPSAATQLTFFAVSSGNHWFVADRAQGFYRSTDQGATWTAINSGLPTKLGWTINVDPTNGDLIASTFSGSTVGANPVKFFRSSNEGSTWTAIPSVALSSATALTGCVFPAANVVCGGFWAPSSSSGGWVSTNGGQTTTSFSSPNAMGSSVYSLAVNPTNGDLWFGTEQMGIFRSADNGFTWKQESPPDTAVDSVHGIRDGNIYGITFDRNGDVLFSSQGGIWKSSPTSGGYSWTNVLPNHNTSDGKSLGRDSAGDLFYSHNSDPSDPSVVRCSTDDGNTWVPCDSGIPQSLVSQQFLVSPADGRLYAVIRNESGTSGSIYRSISAVQ